MADGLSSRSPLWREAFVASIGLIGALIGSGATYLTTHESIQSSYRSQDLQLQQQRSDAARQKRGEVYSSLLRNANDYAVQANDIVNYIEAHCRDSGCSPAPTELKSLFSKYQNARFKMQGSINDVYVYGSSDAVSKGRAISATLPATLGHLDELGGLTFGHVDDAAFGAAYQQFEAVMCREVSPLPRKDC